MSPRRIAKLNLSSFKGFRSPVEVDLDADLVLLVGPNGHGKTSIIEALELVTTGEIQQRIGDRKEFSTRDFVHRHARREKEAEARADIILTWQGVADVERARLLNGDGAISVEGPWSKMREQDWGRRGRKNLLRTTSFLYSDALGAMLGLDLEARKEILDSYIPEGERLAGVSATLESLRTELSAARSKVTAALPDREALSDAEGLAARTVERAWMGLGKTEIRFTRRGDKASILKNIEQPMLLMADALRILVPKGSNELYMLGSFADAVHELAKQEQRRIEEEALGRGADDADLVVIEERLRGIQAAWGTAPIPSATRILFAADYFGSESDISEELESVREHNKKLRADLECLWHEERIPQMPNGVVQTPVGIVPLLLNLSRVRFPDGWEHEGVFRSSLDAAAGVLEKELHRWKSIEEEIGTMTVKERVIEERLKYRRKLSLVQPIVQNLADAWKRRFGDKPLPMTNKDEHLDLSAIQQVVNNMRQQGTSPAAEQKPAKLRLLGEALQAWAIKRREVERADTILRGSPLRADTVKELDQLGRLIERLGKRGQNDLSTRLRARAVEQRYRDPIDTAMRRVLAGYAHRQDLMDGAHALFDKQGYFRVRVGDEKVATGISSLSRSQLTSIAFSLAVAANLGQQEPPLGFICLDDVSDAFDLNNLAADACMLRMLAYGTGRTRRQLILTNHSDALTDRLVPLLLPPHGRSMRIVQLVGQPQDDIKVKQWLVQEEQQGPSEHGHSPLRSLYRP